MLDLMPRRRWSGLAPVLAVAGSWLCVAMLALGVLPAAEPPTGTTPAASVDAATAGQVQQAIAALDAETFAERERAAASLEALIKRPELAGYLAREFDRRLEAAETSGEVRAQLERLSRQISRPAAEPAASGSSTVAPAAPAADEGLPDAAQLAATFDGLDSDSSTARAGARRRLISWLARVELISPILTEARRRLALPELSLQTRRSLEPVLDRAREAWVNADPAQVPLPAVDEAQMRRWLDDMLVAEPMDGAARLRRDTARRELTDLIVRDDTRAALLALLEARLAAVPESGREALQELVDFSKPAMAAEVWGHQKHDHETGQTEDWSHRQHITVQHLIVGVPQLVENAARPTHFDRIDDRTAHCVSGNSLTTGDYPVGVAIPHPNPVFETMFYLVNLPTPRQQLAYRFRLRRDEALRLREISDRTLADVLANRRALDELHVMMLAQLDPRSVSRFVGPYFEAVPDRRMASSGGDLAGQMTLHGTICSILATVGTHEAVPALEKLARAGRPAKPTTESPFHIAWVAALAIAGRDPWPGVDDWLAGLIDEPEPLVTNSEPVAELGATAAGLLLDRHGVSPQSFDLEPAGGDAFDRTRFAGYHFTYAAGRKKVKEWWQNERTKAAAEQAP